MFETKYIYMRYIAPTDNVVVNARSIYDFKSRPNYVAPEMMARGITIFRGDIKTRGPRNTVIGNKMVTKPADKPRAVLKLQEHNYYGFDKPRFKVNQYDNKPVSHGVYYRYLLNSDGQIMTLPGGQPIYIIAHVHPSDPYPSIRTTVKVNLGNRIVATDNLLK